METAGPQAVGANLRAFTTSDQRSNRGMAIPPLLWPIPPPARFAPRNSISGHSFLAIEGSDQNISVARQAVQYPTGRELSGADALPHLHPFRHWLRNSCTTRKEMNVIGHQNVMTNPPAIAFCRAFP